MKKPACPDPNTSHLASNHIVAVGLSKRGWAVALTIGNSKAIDLFVENGRRSDTTKPASSNPLAQAHCEAVATPGLQL
jgi:hypothetical protein